MLVTIQFTMIVTNLLEDVLMILTVYGKSVNGTRAIQKNMKDVFPVIFSI